MLKNELWQRIAKNGELIMDGGFPATSGEITDDVIFCTTVVWLYRHTEKGIELLWQKRSPKVDRNANMWDVSAGGHMNYGETFIEAVAREAREEIGVEASPEEFQFVVASPIRGSSIYWCYAVDWTDKPDDFHFDDDEVSEVKWVPLSETDSFRATYAKKPLARDDAHFTMLKDWFSHHGDN